MANRDGEITPGRGTGLKYRDGSERPGDGATDGEYDFEMRGSDGHRLSPEMSYGLKRESYPIGRPFPRAAEDRLYEFGEPNTAYKSGGDGFEDAPDGVITSRVKNGERFAPTGDEGNSSPMRKDSDRKARQ